jgi:hypothetical protein
MGKRAAKAAAAIEGKVVEIVTRTTERRTGDEENSELDVESGDPVEGDVFDDLDDSGARLDIRRTSPVEFAGYVGTYQGAGFTLDRLQEDWGGGKFTIREKTAGGQFARTRHVQVAGKPKNKEAPPALSQAAPAVDGMAQVLASIQASNAAQAKSTEGQITLLTTLLTSLIGREPPKAPPAPDPLAMLEKAANILKPRGGDEAGVMSALMKGIDLGRSFTEGGGEPGMASIFMEGIKTIKEAAAIAPQPQPQPRRIAQAPAGSVPAVEAPNKPEPLPMTDTAKQIKWLRTMSAVLVKKAEAKKSPELYAEVFLDNLPPFVPEALVLETMKDETAIAKLGMLNADVLKFPDWFEEFRAAVVQFIEAPDDIDDDTGEDQDDVGTSAPPQTDDGAGG